MRRYLFLLLVLMQAGVVQAEDKKIYTIGQDAWCKYNKSMKKTYCVDKKNNPITGEIQKYVYGVMVRSYPLKNGVMNGTVKMHYTDGTPYQEKEYQNGVLSGLSKNWDRQGNLESSVPYVQGKIEGIGKQYYPNGNLQAQSIYMGGKKNGETKLYDKDKIEVYSLEYQNDRVVSGTCVYFNSQSQKYYKKEITSEQIKLMNSDKIYPLIEIGVDKCQFQEIEDE